MGKSVKVAIDMGGWNYMWNANTTDYDGIANDLGVEYVSQNTENRSTKDYLRGVNNIKPPQLSIGYGESNDGVAPGGETVQEIIGYCTRRCAPEILQSEKRGAEAAELIGKKIKVARKGASVKSYVILSATVK